MKNLIYIITAVSFILLGCSNIEKSEGETADITAAQMAGREEARKFINRPWQDTLDLQRQLLESRAKKSIYEMKNQPEQAAAYDSAFISTLRTVRPELASQIDKQ
ncbi:MAG: hypothetical protein NC201_06490 [Prevotella sp.]|nr:hypothetical protein [Bacteroides sp.]MCM1366877.1 hypothetical protein [Prevotella sp.]